MESTTPRTWHLTQVARVESPSREQVEQVHQQVGHLTPARRLIPVLLPLNLLKLKKNLNKLVDVIHHTGHPKISKCIMMLLISLSVLTLKEIRGIKYLTKVFFSCSDRKKCNVLGCPV